MPLERVVNPKAHPEPPYDKTKHGTGKHDKAKKGTRKQQEVSADDIQKALLILYRVPIPHLPTLPAVRSPNLSRPILSVAPSNQSQSTPSQPKTSPTSGASPSTQESCAGGTKRKREDDDEDEKRANLRAMRSFKRPRSESTAEQRGEAPLAGSLSPGPLKRKREDCANPVVEANKRARAEPSQSTTAMDPSKASNAPRPISPLKSTLPIPPLDIKHPLPRRPGDAQPRSNSFTSSLRPSLDEPPVSSQSATVKRETPSEKEKVKIEEKPLPMLTWKRSTALHAIEKLGSDWLLNTWKAHGLLSRKFHYSVNAREGPDKKNPLRSLYGMLERTEASAHNVLSIYFEDEGLKAHLGPDRLRADCAVRSGDIGSALRAIRENGKEGMVSLMSKAWLQAFFYANTYHVGWTVLEDRAKKEGKALDWLRAGRGVSALLCAVAGIRGAEYALKMASRGEKTLVDEVKKLDPRPEMLTVPSRSAIWAEDGGFMMGRAHECWEEYLHCLGPDALQKSFPLTWENAHRPSPPPLIKIEVEEGEEISPEDAARQRASEMCDPLGPEPMTSICLPVTSAQDPSKPHQWAFRYPFDIYMPPTHAVAFGKSVLYEVGKMGLGEPWLGTATPDEKFMRTVTPERADTASVTAAMTASPVAAKR